MFSDRSRKMKYRASSFRLALAAICVPLLTSTGVSWAQITPRQVQVSSGGRDPQLLQRYPRYEVQRQDVLSISFPLSPELNQTVTVQPDGYINVQGAASIHVAGLTVPEVVTAVAQAYIGVLHNPIINVDLQDFQKPFYTVSGQVGKPGQYELRADITVQEALAVAGGMTMGTAKTQVFLFRRLPHSTMYEVKMVNMKEILRGKHLNEDLTIQPNDIVYVPEKFITNFRKYVPYSANLGTYMEEGQ